MSARWLIAATYVSPTKANEMIHSNMENKSGPEIANRLYQVIQKNKASEEAYSKAANKVISANLKSHFQEIYTKRKRFDQTLTKEVSRIFPEPLPVAWKDNHIDLWIDIESIIRSSDDVTILNACLQGDRLAVREYNELLEKYSLPFEVYHAIRKHKMFIEVDLQKMSNRKVYNS
ncbi:DUF2383 domain-containing protein [Arenibacter certesii]|uniref:DUF2383 domain-containing protein n=1 Tax=Arenibacter certesii TaxID=228955 RepID=A0A918MGY8_9FLAO|nr:DUF2383 domain-containing protein [Arenibacter certesii]GGW24381.1 hypothetical protein GCM10007383_06020 [Arenibacter certesii]